jgi:Rho termination factor, N-terminal domain
MNKAELESKHLAELHALAAKAGIERYRMLSRSELVEKLASNGGTSSERRREAPQRRRSRERKPRERGEPREPRKERPRDAGRREAEPPPRERASQPSPPAARSDAGERPKRKRRRRRWGRRRKGVRIPDLLLPAAAGRQTIVYAESRETCTALLREVATQLSNASKGPDPIALLIDPSPEELADWRREAPQAEIVAAGKANHADDALAQAIRRAEGGEAVIFLIDSLSRFAEGFADADAARNLLDSALAASATATGSLTVVAAVEKS